MSCIASPTRLTHNKNRLNGSRILILGLAYKPNVDDERESPSYVLMDLLAGARRRSGLLRSLRACDQTDSRARAVRWKKIRRVEPSN